MRDDHEVNCSRYKWAVIMAFCLMEWWCDKSIMIQWTGQSLGKNLMTQWERFE